MLDERLREKLSEDRYRHTQNVLCMAVDMAERFGADADKTRLAALFHDYRKGDGAEDDNLLHGSMAADVLRDEYGVEDADVLNAVRYHTTGRRGMSRLEMIVFLADTLEPGRTYEGVDELRKLAFEDLEAGTLRVLKELGVYLKRNGCEMTADSLEAIDWLEAENREKKNNKRRRMRGKYGI
jgi:putative nucleotidyltransferase with HDIG domain